MNIALRQALVKLAVANLQNDLIKRSANILPWIEAGKAVEAVPTMQMSKLFTQLFKAAPTAVNSPARSEVLSTLPALIGRMNLAARPADIVINQAGKNNTALYAALSALGGLGAGAGAYGAYDALTEEENWYDDLF